MFQIRQSEATAARRRIPILFVSSTDGFSPVTPTSPAAYLSINGATWVASTNAVVVATLAAGQSAAGVYYLELTAAELANLGWITVNVQATNARQYNAHIQVCAFDPYDTVRIGLTGLPNVAQGNAGALPTGNATGQVTVATNNDKTGYSLTQTFPANFSSMAITVGGAVTAGTVSDKTGYSLSGTQTFNLTGSITGNLSGSVGSVTGAVGSVTGNVGGSVASVTGAVGSVTGNVGGNVVGSIGSLTATAVQNIWDDATSTLTTVGSVGKLIVDNLNATVSSRSTLTDAQVWASATRTLTSGANIVLAKGVGVTGFNDITANNVWSETLPGSYTSTQAGFKLNAAGSAADPWSTTLPGAYTSGTAGFIIGNNLNATVSSRMATFTLPTNFSSLAISGTGAVTAGTVSDKTGYSLTQSFPVNFATLAISGTGAVTAGTVSDKTGYSLSGSQTFSTTGSVGSVTSGVTVTTNNDKTGYSLAVAPLDAAGTASAVWNALLASYGTANTFGARVVRTRSTSPQNEVTITGSYHIAADVHEMQPDVISSTSLATSAVDEISTGIWNDVRATSSPTGGIPAVGTYGYYLDSRVSTAGGGGGGGSSVEVRQGPFIVKSEQDTTESVVETFVGSSAPLQIQITDADNTPVSLSGTVNVKTYNSAGTLVETAGGTIDYAGLGYISATITSTTTATAGRYTVVVEVTDATLVKYGGLQLLVKAL